MRMLVYELGQELVTSLPPLPPSVSNIRSESTTRPPPRFRSDFDSGSSRVEPSRVGSFISLPFSPKPPDFSPLPSQTLAVVQSVHRTFRNQSQNSVSLQLG